jgi:hypothetical protein
MSRASPPHVEPVLVEATDELPSEVSPPPARAHTYLIHDATETVILGCEHPHAACTERVLQKFGVKSKFESAFPMISEAGKSSECVVAVLLLAGAASGFIGSVVGTSRCVFDSLNLKPQTSNIPCSPPQLFAFTYLDLTKGDIFKQQCSTVRFLLRHAIV